MSMTEWAENEVRIACERERAESKTPEGEWDYGWWTTCWGDQSSIRYRGV